MMNSSQEAVRLLFKQSWLALATVDEHGIPSVTYVPFASVDGAFGIVVSRLAAHTANLLARRAAGVLLVDDNHDHRDVYTRARISIAVAVSPNEPGSAKADAIWSVLERRHGETVRTLRVLPDFSAITLEPRSGRLVLGFAAARDVRADAIVLLLRSIEV